MKDTSILIVDDEESVRRVLASHLKSTYLCITASSAEEACQIFTASPFKLVLTDINMPGASGLDLCETIQKLCTDTVVVMLSAHTEIQYAIEAMRQGAFDYITKPFDLPQVTMSVDRALRYQALVAAKRNYEKYDGSGYPDGLCGNSIHINARIFAVADALDAITSYRTYRSAQSYSQARAEIVGHSGTHFDPEAVKAFLCVTETEWDDIRRKAQSGDYLEQIIDKREIRSFIVSLKGRMSEPLSTPLTTMVS